MNSLPESIYSFPRVETMFIAGLKEVTGSCTALKVLTSDDQIRWYLVDVGAEQGEYEWRNLVNALRGEQIEAVFLTHAHYDHVGGLAYLYKMGFRGKIYVSEVTSRLITAMLYDGAKVSAQKILGAVGHTKKLYQQMSRHLTKKLMGATTHHDMMNFESALSQFADAELEPLYTKEDVEEVLKQVEIVDVNRYVEVADGVKTRFMPTTHQNGACRVELHFTDIPTGGTYNMAFSGDIGPSDSLLYKQKFPYTSKKIDCLMLEVLHGIKPPEETLSTSIKRLAEIIRKGIRQKKHIVLAGFSLDRNAMLVYLMNELRKQGTYVHLVIDSPLTMCQLSNYQSTYLSNPYWFKDLGYAPFDDDDFEVIKNYRAHTFSVNQGEAPRVIITASATGTGGRIVDYFEHGIQRPDYVFVFCGWSSPDSPSSILHDARFGQMVEMPNGTYIKRCKTYRLHGFSSHGYLPEMVEAVLDYPACSTLILNHARNDDREAVAEELQNFFEGDIVIPEFYDTYIFSKDGVEPVEHEQALRDFDPIIDRTAVQMVLAVEEDDGDDDFVEGELFP